MTVFGRPDVKAVHFVGVGGAGMNVLAGILISLGLEVSGSDLRRSPATERLAARGASIREGHRSEQAAGADLLVYSSAVRRDNPELAAARSRGVPILHRSELLGGLMKLKRGVAVAGSHGKTSTAAMIAWILVRSGYAPSLALGGDAIGLEDDPGWGAGDLLVAEADESDGSLERLAPAAEVITGLDLDHVDYYSSWEKLIDTFRRFVDRLPPEGTLVIHQDTADLERLRKGVGRVLTYGLNPGARVRAAGVRLERGGSCFTVEKDGDELGEAALPQLGLCNVQNSLGAIALCLEEGVPFPMISRALAGFRGVRRRLEIRSAGPVMVVVDYAHHPVEIVAALAAVRTARPRKIWCVFQPHRYTRTRHFFRELAESLLGADRIIITELYPAFELPLPGVSSALLVDALKERGRADPVLMEQSAIRPYLEREVAEGDVVVIMGAGDVGRLAGDLARNPLRGG
ncbi:MAG: UDP-N-acetylmuramate--L-alanine ligase [PVC group bacterium]